MGFFGSKLNFNFLNWGRASLEGLPMFEGMHPNVVVVLFSCFSILQCRQSHESRTIQKKIYPKLGNKL